MTSETIRREKFKKLWPDVKRAVEKATGTPFDDDITAVLAFPQVKGVFVVYPELLERCDKKTVTLDDWKLLPDEMRPAPEHVTQEKLDEFKPMLKRIAYIFGPNGTRVKAAQSS